MRKIWLAILMSLSIGIAHLPLANADTIIFNANSPEDRKQPADMNYRYDPIGVSVEISDSNKAELVIKVNFASSLSATSFMNYGNAQPLLRVKIMNNLTTYKGDVGYVWLDALNNVPYQGSTRLDVNGSIYADPKLGPSAGRISLSSCKPKTWMDSGVTSKWVAFSIDRNCADINDMFWVTAFMDSDTNAGIYIYDSKYVPADPLMVDTHAVARPPKMKNQTVAFGGSIGTQNLDNPQASTTVASSLGLPVVVTSLTPNVCTPTTNGFKISLALNSAGTCSLDAFAPGNDLTNPSPHVTTSFTVNPKVMVSQEFYWTEPDAVQVGDEPFDLFIYSSSHLDVTVTTKTPGVCQFRDPSNPSVVTIVGDGDCVVSVSQAGNDKYFPRLGDEASFYVDAAPIVTPTTKPSPRPTRTKSSSGGSSGGSTIRKLIGKASAAPVATAHVTQKAGVGGVNGNGSDKVTIKCKKGALTKTITGTKKSPPHCPSGYTLVK